MFNTNLEKQELKDAVKYERLLQKEATAPTVFEQAILTEDLAKSAGRINIARIARGSNLQNAILDQLLKDDNLDDFNKYFEQFNKLLKNKKYTSLEQFKKDFAYFLDNQLLLPTKPTEPTKPAEPVEPTELPEEPTEPISESSAPPLETAAQRKKRIINDAFIRAIEQDTGESIENVKFIELFNPGTNERSGIDTELKKVKTGIRFKALKSSSVEKDQLNYIRNILGEEIPVTKAISIHPKLVLPMPGLAVPTIRRPKPPSTVSSAAISSEAVSSGEGLFPLKKKSTHIRYR